MTGPDHKMDSAITSADARMPKMRAREAVDDPTASDRTGFRGSRTCAQGQPPSDGAPDLASGSTSPRARRVSPKVMSVPRGGTTKWIGTCMDW